VRDRVAQAARAVTAAASSWRLARACAPSVTASRDQLEELAERETLLNRFTEPADARPEPAGTTESLAGRTADDGRSASVLRSPAIGT
jgi:hypothetical protein